MMKNLYLVLFSLLFTIALAGEPVKTNIITPDLQEYMEQENNEELIRINIRFKEQNNLLNRYSEYKALEADIRREKAIQDLKAFSKESQKDLLAFLSQQKTSDYKMRHAFWISNVITCYASESLIQELAQRDDLDRIDIDEERILIEKMPEPIPFDPNDKGVDEITYNVTKVNADDVWALGYTGQGVIVSVIDAGVNYNHVDLADHMWESAE